MASLSPRADGASPAALDANSSLNPFEITFSINAVTVPRDRSQLNGWDFANNSTTAVEFFGQGCQAVQAVQMLQAKKSCAQDICGTAAVSVETKPRVVQLLLDGSASRLECVDGSVDCVRRQLLRRRTTAKRSAMTR